MSLRSCVAKIVDLTKYRSEMKHPALLQLLNYWESLRADRKAPYRSEVDPSGIEAVLPHVFVLQAMADGNFRIRLSGKSLTDTLDMEMRGMLARTIAHRADRLKFDSVIAKCLSDPQICEMTMQNEAGVDFQLLLLPLRDAAGTLSRVMGAIVCTATDMPAAPTGRMSIKRIKQTRIISTQQRELGLSQNAAVGGMAEDAAPFTHASDAPKTLIGRGHLRLVHSSEN